MKSKSKTIVYLIIILILLIVIAVKLFPFRHIEDFYPQQQVSSNVLESKRNNVFINEYEIYDIKQFDSLVKFPIKEIWLEKNWEIKLDKNKKIINEINESALPLLVCTLNPDTFFNENNFLKSWKISTSDERSSIGLINGKINIEFINSVPDSLQLFIYKENGDLKLKNNLIKVASFKIKHS